MSGPDIEITAPDGSVVVFPAGTSDEVIAQAMRNEYGGPESADLYDPQNNVPDDGGGQSTQAPVEVEINRGVMRRGDRAVIPGLDGEPDQDLGSWEEYLARQQSLDERDPSVYMDALQSFPGGVARGIAGIVGLPRMGQDLMREGVMNLMVQDPKARDMIRQYQAADPSYNAQFPTTDAINGGIQSVAGRYHDPETVAGQYSRTIGEFLPGALAPGGLLARVASVLIPALTSETAGQLTKGTAVEPYARFAGGLVGGLGVGGAQAMRGGGANAAIRGATEGVSDQQIAMAQALRERALTHGQPLTTAEALKQVTGGGTGLGRLQRVVEGNTNLLGPMMAARPAQTDAAVARVLDQIAPEVPAQQVAGQAQQAATGVLNRMRQRVNASARPYYDAAEGDVISAEEYAALREMPTYRAAEQAYYSQPEISAGARGPQSIDTVNNVIKQMDRMEAEAAPNVLGPGDHELESVRGQASDLARMLATEASPDLATARLTTASGHNAFVDPLERGPIGPIASQPKAQPDLPGTTNALFPPQPFEGQPQQTAQALRMMGEVDPNVSPSLVRQHLARQYAEASQQTAAGPNQFGGANFAARTFGNPIQEQTILGAVDTAAPMAARDTRDLVEILRATGQRERAGSNTSFNNETNTGLNSGDMGQTLVRTALSPTSVLSRLGAYMDKSINTANNKRIAEMLIADPEEATRLLQRAREAPRGGTAVRLATSLLNFGQDQ